MDEWIDDGWMDKLMKEATQTLLLPLESTPTCSFLKRAEMICVPGTGVWGKLVIRQSVVCNFFRGEQSRQRQLYQGEPGAAWESRIKGISGNWKTSLLLFFFLPHLSGAG